MKEPDEFRDTIAREEEKGKGKKILDRQRKAVNGGANPRESPLKSHEERY